MLKNKKQNKKQNNKSNKDNNTLIKNISLTFYEALYGCQKIITIDYNKICDICSGIGMINSRTCSICNGTKMIDGLNCGICKGLGYIYLKKCPLCNNGFVNGKKQMKINIKSNTINSTKYSIKNFNIPDSSVKYNKLIINCNVINDTEFYIKKFDVYYTLKISILDAVLGNSLVIPTIYQKQIKINIPQYSQNNQVITIEKLGIYNSRTHQYGNMYVKLFVQLPEQLSKEQIKILKKLNI